MNIVLILRGPSGVGKSTISKIIQERLGLNWTVIDVDKLKYYMPLKDGNVNRAERTQIAHNVSHYFAKSMYDKGYDVILEEMYREAHNENFVQFLQGNNIQYKKVFLAASIQDIIHRSKERQKQVPEEETRRLYNETQPLTDDLVVDTSKYSSEEAAEIIMKGIDDDKGI